MKKAGGASTLVWMLIGLFLFSVIYFLGMSLAKEYLPYRYKCALVHCDPPTWETIKDMAFENQNGKVEIISQIHFLLALKPSHDEISHFEAVDVTYVAVQKENTGYYRERELQIYNDETWLLDQPENQIDFVENLPPIAFQERLTKIKLGPYEVYDLIWQDLNQRAELGKSWLSVIVGDLYFDASIGGPDGTMIWNFRLNMDKGQTSYFFNAESGKLIKREFFSAE